MSSEQNNPTTSKQTLKSIIKSKKQESAEQQIAEQKAEAAAKKAQGDAERVERLRVRNLNSQTKGAAAINLEQFEEEESYQAYHDASSLFEDTEDQEYEGEEQSIFESNIDIQNTEDNSTDSLKLEASDEEINQDIDSLATLASNQINISITEKEELKATIEEIEVAETELVGIEETNTPNTHPIELINPGGIDLVVVNPPIAPANDHSDSSDSESEMAATVESVTELLNAANERIKTLEGKKRFTIDSNTPIFGGGVNENVEDWLDIINNKLLCNAIPDDMKITVVFGFVKGYALQTMKIFKALEDKTWADFEAHFREKFKPIGQQNNLRLKMRNLTQTDSVEKYAREFLAIISRINNLSEDEKLFAFREGLKPTIKREITLKDTDSLDAAMTIATKIDQSEGRPENSETSLLYVTPKNAPKNVKPNTFHHKLNYVKNNNNNRNNIPNNNFNRNDNRNGYRSNNDMKSVKCYSCGKLGHKEVDCYSKKKNERGVGKHPNQYGSNGAQKETAKYENYENRPRRLNIVTAVDDETILTALSSKNSLLGTWAIVNGEKVKAYIDCGATTSIISYDIMRKFNWNINETGVKVKIADNAVRPAEGMSDELTVNIAGSIVRLPFIVLNHEDHEILLGLDYLRLSDTYFGANAEVLVFPKGKRVPLTFDEDLKSNEEYGEALLVETVVEEEEGKEADWDLETVPIVPQMQLSMSQMSEFKKLIPQINFLSAKSYMDLGKCNIASHIIRLREESPVYHHPFRMAESEKAALKIELNNLLDAGIIRFSNSEHGCRAFFVGKKGGSKRLVMDFRELNSRMIQLNWPIPLILDILDNLTGSTFFTALDLKSGYFQIPVDEKSKKYTAFTTPFGHFEFNMMPFGLKNAPAEFSRIMQRLLGDLPFVQIYIDDITIHSRSFVLHLEHLKIVLDRLEEANLKLNGSKCVWFANKLNLLGHVVDGNGISMDPKLVDSISKRNPPKNVKQVQQFIGLCNYYRRFIKDFAKIAAPMYNLFKKERAWTWTEVEQASFEKLKIALCNYPVLRPPTTTGEFILETDASGYGIGVTLLQKDENDHEYVVAYASRLLKGAELHYGITDKECLAVVYGMKTFRIYVYGVRFQLRTDHAALKWLLSISDPVGRLSRMAIYIQVFNYYIVHSKGKHLVTADALSRPVLLAKVVEDWDTSPKSLDHFEDEALLYFLKNKTHETMTSQNQRRRVEKLAERLELCDDGMKWFTEPNLFETFKIIPPIAKRHEIIETAHLCGHFQVKSTFDRIKEKYKWKNMEQQVELYVQQCKSCLRNRKFTAVSHPALSLDVRGIFDRVGVDYVFGLPETEEGFKGLIVFTEYLSKYVYVAPIKSKTANETFAMMWRYVTIFGPPKEWLTDRGTEFNNQVISHFNSAIGIVHRVTSAYNPRTNGQTERFNATFIESLRSTTEQHKLNWPAFVPYVCWAYNTRKHSTTEFSPYMLVFGREMNNFENYADKVDGSDVIAIQKRVREINKLFEVTQPQAKEKIAQKQIKQRETQDKNMKLIHKPLESGMKVYAKIEGLKNKLEPRFKGPFTIITKTRAGNYHIMNEKGERLDGSLPLHKLKPYIELKDIPTDNLETQIEKIYKHRTIEENGMEIVQYVVKFKDEIGPRLNEWINEEEFNSIDLINDYWIKEKIRVEETRDVRATRKNNDNNNPIIPPPEKRGRGRPPKNKHYWAMTSPSMILMILFHLILSVAGHEGITLDDDSKINLRDDGMNFHHTQYTEIYGDFKYCETTNLNNRVMELDECDYDKTQFSKGYGLKNHSESENYFILGKRQHEVHGEGIQCKKEIIVSWFNSSWLNSKTTNTYTEIINLTEAECWFMTSSRTCNNLPLKCEDTSCFIENFPNPEYSYADDIMKLGVRCSVFPRIITAIKKSDHLFNKISNPCIATDLSCPLRDSIIVWKENIINNCPLELVTSLNLTFHKENKLFISVEDNILFQFKNESTKCELDVIETKEGLFLSKDKDASDLKVSEDMLNPIHELLLADSDKSNFDRISEAINLQNKLNTHLCRITLTFLRLFHEFEDNFFSIADMEGNEAIIFNKNGILYVPHCTPIESIKVLNEQEQSNLFNEGICSHDIPILFDHQNTSIVGFLTPNRLIRRTNKHAECRELIHEVWINENTILRQNESLVFITNASLINTKLSISMRNISNINFNHLDLIKENIIADSRIISHLEFDSKDTQFDYLEKRIMETVLSPGPILKRLEFWIWLFTFIVIALIASCLGVNCYIRQFKFFDFSFCKKVSSKKTMQSKMDVKDTAYESIIMEEIPETI